MKNRQMDEILIRETVRFILTESLIDDAESKDPPDGSKPVAPSTGTTALKELFFGKSTEAS